MLLALLLLIAATAPVVGNAADQPAAPGAQLAPAQPDAVPAAVPLPDQPLRDSSRDAVLVLGAVVLAMALSILNYVRAGK